MPMNTTLDRRTGLAQRAVAGGGRGLAHLLDDLGGGQVALQTALAGGAERAGHAAPGLAGHADRRPVRVAHQHGLGAGAVVRRPERLAGGAVVAGQLLHRGDERRQQRGEGLPCRRGQVGHRGEVGGEVAEVVAGELVGPERGQAELGDDGAPLRGLEVGEVAGRQRALGGVEHEGKGGHGTFQCALCPDAPAMITGSVRKRPDMARFRTEPAIMPLTTGAGLGEQAAALGAREPDHDPARQADQTLGHQRARGVQREERTRRGRARAAGHPRPAPPGRRASRPRGTARRR